MAITQIQNTFTLGELDPLLLGRTDFEGYYKGARKMRDVICIPQGGFKRCFGTYHSYLVKDLEKAGTPYITDPDYVAIIQYRYSFSESFHICIRPSNTSSPINPATDGVAIDIYLNNVFQVTVTNSDASHDVPYKVQDIIDINWVITPTRVLILHHNYRPRQLERNGADNNWVMTPMTIANFPQYDFSVIDGIRYNSASFTFTPSATSGAITLTASANIFTQNHVGGLYSAVGPNTGVMRITAVASATACSGYSITSFTAAAAIPGNLSTLTEPLWSDGTAAGTPPGPFRGWPKTGTIYQNCLYLANTPLVPHILSKSVSGDYENFDDSMATDDFSFSYQLASNALHEIQHIVGANSLIVITSDGVFATSALLEAPLTPGNIYLQEQIAPGGNNVTAWKTNDQILYVQNNGRSIQSVDYDLLKSRFKADDATVYATHIIDNPREAIFYQNPYLSDGNFYIVANSDGTMAIFQTQKDDLIKAWTLRRTQGQFVDLCADDIQAYTMIQRQIGASDANENNQVVYNTNSFFNSFTDVTATSFTAFVDDDDYIVFGNDSPFFSQTFTFTTPASADCIIKVEYLNKNGVWDDIVITDTTSGFTANGMISWASSTVIDWQPLELNGVERKYWLRIQRTLNTLVTSPVISAITTDLQSVISVEQIAFDYLLDNSYLVTTDGSGNLSGLTNLAGMQVWLLQQTSNTYGLHAGIPLDTYFVANDGTLSVGADYANTTFVVGINYYPEMVFMPPAALQINMTTYQPKHVKSVYIDYYQSGGLQIADIEIPMMFIGQPAVDVPLNLQTAIYQIPPFQGWSPRDEVKLIQVEPMPFTIIGCGLMVEY